MESLIYPSCTNTDEDSTMRDERGREKTVGGRRREEGVLVSTFSGRKERSNDEIELDMKNEEENDDNRVTSVDSDSSD
uniref:Uncharacterized protein n=1 Tax=Pristionchus pacificus TaxID=54126 RepID=A0A2A6C2H3_PRIPA|eukprot:PDM72309.1 hypothetical protein PRIPAC_38743 [Pristionchus pacificus]